MDIPMGIDWREAWCARDNKRRARNGQAYWNNRAVDYVKKAERSDYSQYSDIFFEYLKLQPGKSVLDMGCGNGILTLPLARAKHQVIAADFSDAMLESLTKRVQDEGLSTVTVKKLDWDEDWLAAGMQPKSLDIALASRSIMVRDLYDAIEKLSMVARDRVCVTMATSLGPRSLTEIVQYIGRSTDTTPDYIYGFNLLHQMGYYPEVRYIDSLKQDRFDHREQAFAYFKENIGDLDPSEERLLEEYLKQHLVEDASDSSFHMDYQRLVRWAFLAWEVDSRTDR